MFSMVTWSPLITQMALPSALCAALEIMRARPPMARIVRSSWRPGRDVVEVISRLDLDRIAVIGNPGGGRKLVIRPFEPTRSTLGTPDIRSLRPLDPSRHEPKSSSAAVDRDCSVQIDLHMFIAEGWTCVPQRFKNLRCKYTYALR